ncbi:MAG: ACP S-malonyltransferase [Acidobacteriota bacterium]
MIESTNRWAAIFPGQGSQAPGMGKELYDTYPQAREVFQQADEALGESLSRVCFEGPEDALKLTRNTQPALLTVSMAAWRVLEPTVPSPGVAAGHSLGEYSALVAAGVLQFTDAVRAVRLRGEAMQQAVPFGVGAMAAVIGLSSLQVDELCASVRKGEEVLVPANFNAQDQIVVAGHKSAVDRLIDAAPAAGAKRAIALPVSAPFHCPLMNPAAEALAAFLETLEFSESRFPVIANVDAQPVPSGVNARENLVRQVASPVRWVETMLQIERAYGATVAVEVGCGRVLAGLSRRINENLRTLPGGTPAELQAAATTLAQ